MKKTIIFLSLLLAAEFASAQYFYPKDPQLLSVQEAREAINQLVDNNDFDGAIAFYESLPDKIANDDTINKAAAVSYYKTCDYKKTLAIMNAIYDYSLKNPILKNKDLKTRMAALLAMQMTSKNLTGIDMNVFELMAELNFYFGNYEKASKLYTTFIMYSNNLKNNYFDENERLDALQLEKESCAKRGLCYMKMGQPDNAMKDFHQVKDDIWSDTNYYLEPLVYYYLGEEKKLERWMADFELDELPKDFDDYVLVAWAYLTMGKEKEASHCLALATRRPHDTCDVRRYSPLFKDTSLEKKYIRLFGE